MSHPILGLDLGSRRIQAVLIETTLRGFTVSGTAEEAVPPATEGGPSAAGRMAGAVAALLAARGWSADVAAAASLPGVAASHLVTLPFSDARRIEQTVQYEVEAAIPFDLDQVAWDWQVLDSQAGRSDLFIGLARRDELTAWVAELAAVGVDPAVVSPGGPVLAALWAAGAVADPAPAGEAELVVDLGVDRTHACVVSEGRCLFARTFASGTSTLLRSAARSAGRNPDEVPVDGATPDWLDAPEGPAALRAGIGPLVRELRATLHAFESRATRRPVVRIRMAGEAGGWPGLAALVGEELVIPAEPLRLTGPVSYTHLTLPTILRV